MRFTWRSYAKNSTRMRKLSLDHVFGCSTAFRHGLTALPNNRFAFIAGCYLVIHDCSTSEQLYLSFGSIEFIYVSPTGAIMGVIDRVTPESDTRIHLYSTESMDPWSIIEPDRFGSFVSLAIDDQDELLMILHGEPGYMLTIREHQDWEEDVTLFSHGLVRF